MFLLLLQSLSFISLDTSLDLNQCHGMNICNTFLTEGKIILERKILLKNCNLTYELQQAQRLRSQEDEQSCGCISPVGVRLLLI